MHKTVVPAPCLTQKTFRKPVTQSIFSSCGEGSKLHGQGRLCRYSRQLKLNSEFYQKKELEENQSEKHRIKGIVCPSQSKIPKDASIPFQIKPWEYEEMKNSGEKVNIGAFGEVKKQYLGGRDYSPEVNNNRNETSNPT